MSGMPVTILTVKSKIYVDQKTKAEFLFYISPAMTYGGDITTGNKTEQLIMLRNERKRLLDKFDLARNKGEKGKESAIIGKGRAVLAKTKRLKYQFEDDFENYSMGRITRRDMCRMWQGHCHVGLLNTTYQTLNLVDNLTYYIQFSDYANVLELTYARDYGLG